MNAFAIVLWCDDIDVHEMVNVRDSDIDSSTEVLLNQAHMTLFLERKDVE